MIRITIAIERDRIDAKYAAYAEKLPECPIHDPQLTEQWLSCVELIWEGRNAEIAHAIRNPGQGASDE